MKFANVFSLLVQSLLYALLEFDTSDVFNTSTRYDMKSNGIRTCFYEKSFERDDNQLINNDYKILSSGNGFDVFTDLISYFLHTYVFIHSNKYIGRLSRGLPCTLRA